VPLFFLFFFSHPSPTETYTLSLHDALPISGAARQRDGAHPPGPRDAAPTVPLPGGRVLPARPRHGRQRRLADDGAAGRAERGHRSEEHTSELQSLAYLVCRLLLEKKKHIDN